MAQTIIVIIIVSLALLAAGVKLYRFFRSNREGGCCDSSACASCRYYTKDACGKKDDGN